MKKALITGALCTALSFAGTARATVIEAAFIAAGPSWDVSLTVVNDGTPAGIDHFTVFFEEGLYAGLTLLQSPAGWDSVVIQPDLAIPDAGFLDATLLAPTPALAPGQSQGGFALRFEYAGTGVPGSLHYEIVDAAYQVLFSGQTVTAAVPEPGGAPLALLGLAALAWRVRHRAVPVRHTADEVTP